jgi:hypothetical protein
MNLKYSLAENLLTEREDDYSVQVHAAASLDIEAVIKRMLQRGTTRRLRGLWVIDDAGKEIKADVIIDNKHSPCSQT